MVNDHIKIDYPKKDVDPKEKSTKEYLLKYAKAFWADTDRNYPNTMLHGAKDAYDTLRLYGMGKQDEKMYYKYLGVKTQLVNGQEIYGDSQINISWKIIPFIAHLRDIVIKKVMDVGFNIVATPIDTTGGSIPNSNFNKLKAKLFVRQMLQQRAAQGDQQAAIQLQQHPELQLSKGEPVDIQDFERRVDMGEQFNRSMDAEQAIALCFHKNNINKVRKQLVEDAIDWGVSIVEDELDSNDNPVFYRADARQVITNRFSSPEGDDIICWGELINVSDNDLIAQGFSQQQLNQASSSIEYGLSRVVNATSPDGMRKVLRFEFESIDRDVYEQNYKNNNYQVARADFNAQGKKFTQKKKKRWYCGKWVVGSDLIYDEGLKFDMKRTVNQKTRSETTSCLNLMTYSFFDMNTGSYMQRVVPLIDDYQRTYLRMQNVKSRMVDNGWSIDLNALEEVLLDNGNGGNMSVLELIDMFRTTGIAVYMGKDLGGATGNYQPIRAIQNNSAAELATLYQELLNIKGNIKEMWGLNEATDSSTIGERRSNMNINVGITNTNNALWPLVDSHKRQIEKLAVESYKRVQQSIRRNGEYSGWMPALNSNAPMLIKADDKLTLMDCGIMLEIAPSEDDRAQMLQRIQGYVEKGLLRPGAEFIIMSGSNIKQMQMALLAEAKDYAAEKQQQALGLQQQNGNIQVQSAQEAGKVQQDTDAKKLGIDKELLQLTYDLQLRNQQDKLAREAQTVSETNSAKTTGHIVQAHAKENVAKINQGLPEEGEQPQDQPPPPAPAMAVQPPAPEEQMM